MQLVGTLSWSMVGLVAPAKQPNGKCTSLGTLLKPVRRGIDPPEREGARDGTKQPASAGGPAGGASGVLGGRSRGAQASQLARGEVRLLEIDWSQIVRRCMDGDSGAWAQLVREHHRRVYGLCYRFTGNAADAEDLT